MLDPALPRKRKLVRNINRATILVVYPDGCRTKLVTRPDAAIATNTVAFAQWLANVAEEILEAATREGMCAKR